MVRSWKIGATGSVLIGVAILAACSGSGEDSDGSGGKGSGAAGGTGGATGGTGGATGGTGGATGGTGGATGGTGGATGGTAGMATGGTAGMATGGTAGAAGGSGGATGPYACKGTVATCNAISNFGVDPVQWGSGDFHGGVSVFGTGIMRDPATDALHITGMVGGYGRGFNLWFSYCSDLSAFTGVSFVARGTAGMPTATDMPNIIQFQLQSNSDYPWEPFVMSGGIKGGCTAPTGMDPWGFCQAPTYNATLGDAAQTVTWAMMAGGAPVMWDATMSPKEIVGIQFQFPWKEMGTEYAVDVTIDDIKFTGAAAEMDCGTYMASGGAGGMGNAGAAGSGTAGAAGSDTAGAGGAAAGAAGTGAGGADAGAAGTGAGGAGAGGVAAGGAGAGGVAAGGAGAGGMSGSN